MGKKKKTSSKKDEENTEQQPEAEETEKPEMEETTPEPEESPAPEPEAEEKADGGMLVFGRWSPNVEVRDRGLKRYLRVLTDERKFYSHGNNIRTVERHGPGAERLSPVQINSGYATRH